MARVTRPRQVLGAGLGGCMLNVLRLSYPIKRPKTLWYVASAMGIFVGLGCTIWQAHWAQSSMPNLQEEHRHWQTALQTSLKLPPLTPSQKTAMQTSLTQAKERVHALEKRQSMRQNLEEVQSLLFASSSFRKKDLIQLQKLRWQGGHFDWEGSSSSPEALQALLAQMSQFDRWHVQPQLVQMQSASVIDVAASKAPNVGPKPLTHHVIFKLEGQIEVDPTMLMRVPQPP